MKLQKLIVPVLLSFAWVIPTYACMTISFEDMLEFKSNELKEYGCVRDHVKLRVSSNAGDSAGVIKIAERLKRHGLLDGNSLYLVAEVLFKLGRFSEALDAYLLSQQTPTVCNTPRGSFCDIPNLIFGNYRPPDGKKINEEELFKRAHATSKHYEDAKYYRAAGWLREAEDAKQAGDMTFDEINEEFDKLCPRTTGELMDFCEDRYTRLLRWYSLDSIDRQR